MKKLCSLIMTIIMLLSVVPYGAMGQEVYLTRDLNKGSGTEVKLSDYKTMETEHFVIIYDTDGANTVTKAQLESLEVVLENCWDLFIDKMGMEPTSTSVHPSGDKATQYKTNVVIMGTGVDHYYLGAGEWGAYGAVDSAGYPYFMCSVTAIGSPTVVAHEFGHAVHYAQGDNAWENNIFLGPWFEAVANWFAEQYIYEYLDSNSTQFSHLYLRANHLTKMNGRGYYEAWPFLQYLTEDLDNTGVYGKTFVQKLLSYNSGSINTLFWEVLEANNGELTVADTVGMYASHMASLDFKNETRYNTVIDTFYRYNVFYPQQRFTMLEKLGKEGNTYAVPVERAPQAMGYNIVPLDFTPGEVEIELSGLTDAEGADWRGRLVKENAQGETSYTKLFSAGEKVAVSVQEGDSLYLTVAATPSLETMTRHTITGWAEHSHESKMPYENKTIYPYSVTITGAVPMERERPAGMFRIHPNGGGRVSFGATVADTAYVGENAVVMGNARVSDNAVIDGYAIVGGNCEISDNAYVGDYAVLFDRAKVSGNGRVLENACIYVDYKVSENAVVKGSSLGLYNGEAKGEAMTYGDWFEDGGRVISGGSFSGYNSLMYDNTWVNSKYAPLMLENSYVRPFVKNMRSRYEFENNLRDTVSYSDVYPVGKVETRDGCAVFNGGYIQLNESALLYDNLKLSIRVKGEGEIISLGTNISARTQEDNVVLNIYGQEITVGGYQSEDFNDVDILMYDGKAALVINGESEEMSVDKTPIEAMRDGESYLGHNFSGEMDYLRIYDNCDKEALDEEIFFDVRDNNESGNINNKKNDEASAWYGWDTSVSTGVSVEEGLKFTGAVTATVTTPGYVTGKFSLEFTPYGGKTYPDHGVLDIDGNVLFAHRYAADANVIHIGRGEINAAVRGNGSIKDTTGQDRLKNFVCEKLCSGTGRSDRGSIVYSADDRVRITAENMLWSDELAEKFEKSENKSTNMNTLNANDAVYVVRYSILSEGEEIIASESVYMGHFEGFGGFKTAGGSAGNVVGYKDLVLYGEDVLYKCEAESKVEEDGSVVVTLKNAREGSFVILALFENDVLKEVKSKVYDGTDVVFDVDIQYTAAKIMVWSDYGKMKAVADVVRVK